MASKRKCIGLIIPLNLEEAVMRASAIVTSEVRGGVWILDIDDDLGSGENDKYNISLDQTLKGLGQGLCVIDTSRPKKENA